PGGLPALRGAGGPGARPGRPPARGAAAMRGRRLGHLLIAAALLAAVALVAVELQRGALTEDALAVPDPCGREVTIDTGGLDGQAQRVGLRALDAAACELGTTREELLLEVAGSLQESRDFPPGTEDAIREGVVDAIDREEEEGRLNVV